MEQKCQLGMHKPVWDETAHGGDDDDGDDTDVLVWLTGNAETPFTSGINMFVSL